MKPAVCRAEDGFQTRERKIQKEGSWGIGELSGPNKRFLLLK
jgi:hypothetical protein